LLFVVVGGGGHHDVVIYYCHETMIQPQEMKAAVPSSSL
jgi:hypothetical protein